MNTLALAPEEEQLRRYIPDDTRIKTYTARLKACTTWNEAESCVLIPMIRNEEIPVEKIARKEFYSALKPFLVHIKSLSDTTLWNHFTDIATLLKKQKECGPMAMQSLFSGGIELPVPQPGEEARCIIEVLISPSEKNREKLCMSALLLGIECRKADIRHFDGEQPGLPHAGCYLLSAPAAPMHSLLSYLASLFGTEEAAIQYRSRLLRREGLTFGEAARLAKSEMK